jgi:class 3 adenylate cyclase/tetratricopeptide (TPR) repeat protein
LICASCGAENAPANRFCGQCASSLSRTCPSCGAIASPDQRFCGQCAVPLQGDVAPHASTPAQVAAPTENRHVSVLFVDLVGFTTFSESRDAEDVREMLSRYFDTARTIVGRYGGVVEKFIGDAVMAVWGVPAAREDDAERAVRAALDVVDAVAALGDEVGVQLAARGGVATGSVAAVNAPGEGIVVGDRVNTASRVQSVAEPGTVLVDESTRRTTSAAIAYADAGEHLVKGKAEPLQLWHAQRVVAGVGGEQRVDGLEARFIGRDADLRLVKELFHACVDRRSARLASVVGIAGVGKSRMRWEFFKYVDGLVDFVCYHTGRCPSYGEGVAYSALAEMVRQRFRIAEDDSEEVAAQRLADGLAELITDPREREFLLPRLGTLLGTSDESLGREELFAGWRLLFERLAEREPVVLAFEDVQWADTGLLDFIDYLLDWASDSPIFVVTFARPELAETRPGWPAGRRNATSLYLEPLAPPDMAALLDDLVDDLPEVLRQRIVERSEGIPLYALETVRSLIDRDVVVPQEGVYRVVGDVGDLDVPGTLTSLLAARIDALPAEERSLIKDLAVLAGSFPRATVAAVCDLDEATFDRLLAHLVRKEFLAVRSDKLSPDRGQYVFAQSLLRTVAYDMLAKHERKARHLRVAEHLRSSFANDGEDVADVVAAHYRAALLVAENDPDAHEIRRQALAAYELAGRRAMSIGAPETAMSIYRTAAELADDADERLSLRERAADMALHSGRHQDTFDMYAAVRKDYAAAGRTRDWARLAVGEARGHARLGRQAEAIQTLLDAMPHLDDGRYSPELAHAAAWLANFLVFAGRAAEAEQYTEQALVAAQALGLPASLCQALNTRGMALSFLDRHEEAIIHAEAAVALARKHNLPEQEENALIQLTDMAMTADLPDTPQRGEEAIDIARRLGNRYVESVAASNLLYSLLYLGEFDRAELLVAEMMESGGSQRPHSEYLNARLFVIDVWRGDTAGARSRLDEMAALRDSDVVDDICVFALFDAMIANLEGRHDDALRHASEVVDRMRVQIAVRHESLRPAWVEAMEAALQLGDLGVAEELLDRIRLLPPGFVPAYMQAESSRFGARIAAARGDAPETERLFADAERRLADLGYEYWLARTRLDHAEWLASVDRRDEAYMPAAQAYDAFSRLRASAWVARAAALVPQSVSESVVELA